MDNNDTFDELIETLERDRSIKRDGMRQIASAFLGYTVPRVAAGRKTLMILDVASHPTRSAGQSGWKGSD